MCKILLLIVLLINSVPVLADNYFHHYPKYNYRQHYNQYNRYNYNDIANRRLNTLERYMLNRTYNTENDISRLERLENLAFGSTQTGDIKTRFRNVENAILSKNQNTYKKNILSSIGNYFLGQTTGITPSITPYNDMFYPTYNNSYTNQYSNGILNQSYTNLGNTYGSGSSIRILE